MRVFIWTGYETALFEVTFTPPALTHRLLSVVGTARGTRTEAPLEGEFSKRINEHEDGIMICMGQSQEMFVCFGMLDWQ